jgi:hypothetical protein
MTVNGTILVYGNDAMLVTTRCLILERAGYRVLTAQAFGNAMLMLMNHQIDIIVLCQSLKAEERRGILETARAIQPEIKCAVIDFDEREAPIEGVALIEGFMGPSALLNTIGSIFTQKASVQNRSN